MIYKVGLWGASGRMGQEIAALLRDGYAIDSDMLELTDCVALSGRIASLEGVEVRLPTETPLEAVHVWIDFSRPSGTMTLLAQAKAAVLIGTTGFSFEEKERIAAYAERYPVCLAPNLSPGMAWFRRMLRLGVPKGFDVVLEETHHTKKVDSPSGTAQSLIAILKENLGEAPQTHAVRAGGVPGEHTVRFVSEEEELRIEHRVWNRAVFAKGALKTALNLTKKERPGLFSVDELMHLN